MVIAGNHELTIDSTFYNKEYNWRRWPKKINDEGQECQPMDTEWARQILCKAPACIFTYLENEATTVVGGYKIYGSPCQSAYWAFHHSRGENISRVWEKIPTDTDILLTHSPPVGHGDLTSKGEHLGCVDLLAAIADRVKPLFHVFGHVHEGYGATTNGTTIFVNAAIDPHQYKSSHPPLVFDLPIRT